MNITTPLSDDATMSSASGWSKLLPRFVRWLTA
jgi:hypothetical protein